MDPNTALSDLIDAMHAVFDTADRAAMLDATPESSEADTAKIAEYDRILAGLAITMAQGVESLTEWISKGGALPTDWQR